MRELVPGLTRLAFPGVNVWLDEGPDGLTVIDSGFPWNGSALVRAVGDRRVARIVLTHIPTTAGEPPSWPGPAEPRSWSTPPISRL